MPVLVLVLVHVEKIIMFWIIVAAILFVIFLPVIIVIAFMLIPNLLILIGVLLLLIGHGIAVPVGLGLVALGGVWAVSMVVD